MILKFYIAYYYLSIYLSPNIFFICLFLHLLSILHIRIQIALGITISSTVDIMLSFLPELYSKWNLPLFPVAILSKYAAYTCSNSSNDKKIRSRMDMQILQFHNQYLLFWIAYNWGWQQNLYLIPYDCAGRVFLNPYCHKFHNRTL